MGKCLGVFKKSDFKIGSSVKCRNVENETVIFKPSDISELSSVNSHHTIVTFKSGNYISVNVNIDEIEF